MAQSICTARLLHSLSYSSYRTATACSTRKRFPTVYWIARVNYVRENNFFDINYVVHNLIGMVGSFRAIRILLVGLQ